MPQEKQWYLVYRCRLCDTIFIEDDMALPRHYAVEELTLHPNKTILHRCKPDEHGIGDLIGMGEEE